MIIIIAIFLGNSCNFTSDKEKGNWIVTILDSQTGEKIDNADIIVTDINKKFTINNKENIISLPQKPYKKNDSKYPYGYTIITSSKGYLPRIDHNLPVGKNSDTNILIELDMPKPFTNSAYTEFFHNSSQNMVADFLNYYLDSNK